MFLKRTGIVRISIVLHQPDFDGVRGRCGQGLAKLGILFIGALMQRNLIYSVVSSEL